MFGSPITPPPYFSITAIKLFDGCTRVYVLSRRYDLTESMFSPDKQEKEKIIVKLFYRVNNEVNIKINTTFSKFIRIWLPLVAVGVVISIVISTALRIPLVQALTAIGLTVALALSGLLFRSFGKDDDRSPKD